MVSNEQTEEEKRTFEPLEIMGVFWLVFGIIILIATVFVKSTPQVPLMRGLVTNIIAGLLLLGAGVLSILKAKAKKRKKTKA